MEATANRGIPAGIKSLSGTFSHHHILAKVIVHSTPEITLSATVSNASVAVCQKKYSNQNIQRILPFLE